MSDLVGEGESSSSSYDILPPVLSSLRGAHYDQLPLEVAHSRETQDFALAPTAGITTVIHHDGGERVLVSINMWAFTLYSIRSRVLCCVYGSSDGRYVLFCKHEHRTSLCYRFIESAWPKSRASAMECYLAGVNIFNSCRSLLLFIVVRRPCCIYYVHCIKVVHGERR